MDRDSVAVTPEEFNVIVACLRKAEMVFDELRLEAVERKQFLMVNQHANTLKVVRDLAERITREGIGQLRLDTSEYRLVVWVLRVNAKWAEAQAALHKEKLQLEDARLQTAYSAGCAVIGAKWEREAPPAIRGRLFH